MDVTHLLEFKPAPRFVFDRLPTHRHRARFQVRTGGAWQPVTWGHFATQIRGVARWLVEHDVESSGLPAGLSAAEGRRGRIEAGDRVAIYAPNSVAWASAALGIQTAGAVFVPIYPASTPEQVAYILQHAEVTFVFVAGRDQLARLERAAALVSHPIEAIALRHHISKQLLACVRVER